MARWRPLEDYTPIARILVVYMWEQRPPLLPSQFAAHMGLPKQLVSSWLSSQVMPAPDVLVHLARQMDQPVSRLLASSGYTGDDDPLLDIPEAWSYVQDCLLRWKERRQMQQSPRQSVQDSETPSASEEAAAGEQEQPEDGADFDMLMTLLRSVQAQDLAVWRESRVAVPVDVNGSTATGLRRGRRKGRRSSLDQADSRGEEIQDQLNEPDQEES